jgi:hypothetical protein
MAVIMAAGNEGSTFKSEGAALARNRNVKMNTEKIIDRMQTLPFPKQKPMEWFLT